MANGVNRVILIGNLGADPEVRYTQSGKAVCTLRMGVTERQKDGEGWKDVTAWVDVVTWDKTAENAAQFLKKGRQVYIEGRLSPRKFKDKDGNDREKLEVVAAQLIYLGGGGDDRKAGTTQRPSSTHSPDPAPAGGGFVDDDVPF